MSGINDFCIVRRCRATWWLLAVAGWVRSVRDMKNLALSHLMTAAAFKDLQAVMNRENLSNYEEAVSCGVGAALIEGVLELTPDRPQLIELQAQTVVIEGPSSPDYPMQKKRHTFVRSNTFVPALTCSVQSSASVLWLLLLSISFSRTVASSTNTPIITASDAEGAGEMFRVTTLDLNNVPRTE